MSNHTAAWHELNESQKEYFQALEAQNQVQDRFLPEGEGDFPESPVRLPDPLTLEVIEELAVVDRRVHETRQRYAKAINAVHNDG